jgi:hypothetical protein
MAFWCSDLHFTLFCIFTKNSLCFERICLRIWIEDTDIKLEVWTDLRVVAQKVSGFGPGLDLLHRTAPKRYVEHFGPYRAILLRKGSAVRSCALLMLVAQSGSGNRPHRLDFLGYFHNCPIPEIAPDNTLRTWHPVSLYRTSNAKVTSDVPRASVNNSVKDYWHLCLKNRILMLR